MSSSCSSSLVLPVRQHRSLRRRQSTRGSSFNNGRDAFLQRTAALQKHDVDVWEVAASKAGIAADRADVVFTIPKCNPHHVWRIDPLTSRRAAHLDKAIGRYAPAVAATTRAALKTLRARFPGARQMVYERRQSLLIGFAPAERGAAVFSLVLYPRWVRFLFLEGVAIDDPEGRLEGRATRCARFAWTSAR